MVGLAIVASGCVMTQGEECGDGAACAAPQMVDIGSETFSVGCPPDGVAEGLLGEPVTVSYEGRAVRGRGVAGLSVDDFVAVSSSESPFCGAQEWGLAYGPSVSRSELEEAIRHIAENVR